VLIPEWPIGVFNDGTDGSHVDLDCILNTRDYLLEDFWVVQVT